MRLFIRPNEFTQPDYTVTFRANDGRAITVGRIFHASAGVPKETPWTWTVEFHQRKGRAEPYQGYTASFEEATVAWKRCWYSGVPPINWPELTGSSGVAQMPSDSNISELIRLRLKK
jgi:hypothetical protein